MLAYSLKLKILILIRWVWDVYLTVILHFLFVWRLNTNKSWTFIYLCCFSPPKIWYSLIGVHRLGKFIFHKFLGTDIRSWQFYEAFFKCSYRYQNYIVSTEIWTVNIQHSDQYAIRYREDACSVCAVIVTAEVCVSAGGYIHAIGHERLLLGQNPDTRKPPKVNREKWGGRLAPNWAPDAFWALSWSLIHREKSGELGVALFLQC